jgi:hypothetical protein
VASNRVERGTSDDHRRIETFIEEYQVGEATERVTTVREEVVPMEVRRKVRETIVPVVTARKVEEYRDGSLVSTELQEVPAQDTRLTAPAVAPKASVDDIRAAVREVLAEFQPAARSMVAPVSARQMLDDRLAKPAASWLDYTFYGVLAILMAAIVYFGWLKNVM